MKTTLSCREFVDFLAEYLNGKIRGDQLARFNAHLHTCPSCASYTRTYRDTVHLGRGAVLCPDEQLPGDVPEDLVRAILDARKPES